jgi:hypothetical protein
METLALVAVAALVWWKIARNATEIRQNEKIITALKARRVTLAREVAVKQRQLDEAKAADAYRRGDPS